MRSRRLQREIDDLVAQGWKIEDEDRDRVVMVDREFGSITSHVLVAILTVWWTMGLGNVVWGVYNYVSRSRRQVLWERSGECPSCGATVSEDAAYCLSCGTDVGNEPTADETIACPEGAAIVTEGSRYCRACGSKLADTMGSSS